MATRTKRPGGGHPAGATTSGGGGVDEPPILAARPTGLHKLDKLQGDTSEVIGGDINVPETKAAARVMAWCIIEDGLRNAKNYGMAVKERLEIAFRTVQLLDGQKHVWEDRTDKVTKTAEELQEDALAKEARLRELLKTKDRRASMEAAIKLAESGSEGGVQ